MMTRLVLRFSMVVGSLILFATFTVLALGTLSSEDVYAHDECTLSTLNGTYIFQARGVITDAGEVHPYAEAGTWTLDGNGNAQGIASLSMDGVSIVRREVFSATYEHVSGCVFTAEDAFGLEFDLYTTPSGATVTYFSPGFSGAMFKQ